ncbi:hypothetical protein [Atlantibacter sp. RC6]|uniref:hypothetical protein n=1 Tax=Atlantibacter sp. RC6 TaxID=2587036 RepID=UPI001606E3BC|nr:hypothetical protein [Atlantibacter sp. RC6]MBB3320961.1 hypothetical protein [Atlantibacter sp. RC6]
MTINERVSDATIDEILAGCIEGVEPTSHEIAMAAEIKQYRAAAEPVAYLIQDRDDRQNGFSGSLSPHSIKSYSDKDIAEYELSQIPLYAAPQVASVPDESAIFDAAIDICRKSDAIDEHAWNRGVLAVMSAFRACLAATAAPAVQAEQQEPVSHPYTLRDDTRRLDWLDAQNKRLNEYYGTAYGWKFDANFQRNAMMLNDSNYPVMSVRQAIDEAMRTAAPQQEAE